MSTAITNLTDPSSGTTRVMEVESNQIDYRTVSKAAVVSVVLSILGLLSYLSSVFVIIPLLGICFGIAAISNFRKFPDQLSGQIANRIAMAASVLLLISSSGMHAYIYATEVPEGYERIS
ncbi:MAG: hypothetical protein AAGA30_20925, partial [Planctomycetota bacterium]